MKVSAKIKEIKNKNSKTIEFAKIKIIQNQ